MRKSKTLLSLLSLGSLAVVLGFAIPARAQSDTPASAPPPAASSSSNSSGGGAGFGVGATAFLSGLTGAQVVYDQPMWHAEAIFGFDTRAPGGAPNPPRTTTFDIAAGGWYHLHRGSSSDFSLGGDIGIITASTSNGGGSATATIFEPGVQARVFVTPNVSVGARVGVTLQFGDNFGGGGPTPHESLSGQVMAGFGFTYFFR